MNSNLFSKKAGRYSPSRLNITIGTVLMTAWFVIFLLHYIAGIVCYIDGTANLWQSAILALIPAAFLAIAVSALYNKWGRSRSLTETI